MKRKMIRIFCFKTVIALALAFVMVMGVNTVFAEPWSFGVMADTQWIGADDGKNPNTVAVEIIRQLNQQFIGYPGLKFVIQVGDLVDSQSTNSLYTTAIFRQQLYDNGIGFFPVRGNHESNKASAATFRTVFPQTQDGLMNNTPDVAYNITNPDASQPNPVKTGNTFTLGTNFSSPPTSLAGDLTGLTYAFDYENARFVLLDQFTPADSSSSNLNPAPNTIDNQQPWISGVLSSKPTDAHAFVFSHKGLITQNHVDGLFGSNPAADPTGVNAFTASLAGNGVRYYMGGHDHMYNRAIVTSPDRSSAVQNLVLASDSSKFYAPFGSAGFAYRTVDPITKAVTTSYTPGLPASDPEQTNDYIYNVLVGGGATREKPVAQELYKVGYYIVTVDGPKVTVDYYSADNTGAVYDAGAHEAFISATPSLAFTKKETFGYSLNGQEFLIGQGQSYTSVQDTFTATTAKILAGTDGSTAMDSAGRAFIKVVDTGWTPNANDNLASNVLTLWGMADLGSDQTDVFTLSMSYDDKRVKPLHLGNGGFGIGTIDAEGNWVNAVDMNYGGAKKFVVGPWNPTYELGTYGVDPSTHTAWAVINYNGEFAVARDIEAVPGHRK